MATRGKLIGSSISINQLGDAEDLLVEIFIRLPDPKSAVQCKPVCKRWNSLLSAPCFSRRFLSHHQASAAGEPQPPPLLNPWELRELITSFLPLPRHIESSKFSVLDSAKDLLLLGFPHGDDELRRTYLVCNPFTKQWVALPLAPAPQDWVPCTVKLVCRPCRNIPAGLEYLGGGGGGGGVIPFSRHLGYHRFRVVQMYTLWSSASKSMPAEVFCSRSGRWTKLLIRGLRCSLDYGDHVLSLDDELYWLDKNRGVVQLDPFGLNQSTLATLVPGSDRFLHDQVHLCWYGPLSSKGALHMISRELTGNGFTVWRLEKQGGGGLPGWGKQYEVVSLEVLRCIGVSCETETLGWKADRGRRVIIGMHPEISEIVFLWCSHPRSRRRASLSCDFRKMELELLAYRDEMSECSAHQDEDEEEVFPSKVTLWPSAIPDYERLRNAYNGSYDCWLLPSNHPTS